MTHETSSDRQARLAEMRRLVRDGGALGWSTFDIGFLLAELERVERERDELLDWKRSAEFVMDDAGKVRQEVGIVGETTADTLRRLAKERDDALARLDRTRANFERHVEELSRALATAEAREVKLLDLIRRLVWDAMTPLCHQPVLDEARAVLADERKGLIELGWFDPIKPKSEGE
jgi:hypothetical protein